MAEPYASNKWRKRIDIHNKHGEHKDVLANTSEENLDFIWSKWSAFCAEAGLEPKSTLSVPSAAIIKTFFDFMNQRGTAQAISNHTYFRRLKQHVLRLSGCAMEPTICKDVNAYIRHHLEGQKATNPREGPVASAQDFLAMLRFLYSEDTTTYPGERQRVQQAFLMQIMAYSALRPSSTTAARKRKRDGGDLCQKNARQKTTAATCAPDRGDKMTPEDDRPSPEAQQATTLDDAEVRLKYGDFRLYLIKDEGDQTRLGIEPQYKHYKGKRRRKQLKTFTYWALPYVLACPAATLLALALHDGALQDIKSVDDLLKLQIPPGMDQIEIYWSSDWYGRCIMRESGCDEPHTELSSTKARYRFGRLGENMGLQHRFVAYCLRRLCLNLLSMKAGPQIRRHVAGKDLAGLCPRFPPITTKNKRLIDATGLRSKSCWQMDNTYFQNCYQDKVKTLKSANILPQEAAPDNAQCPNWAAVIAALPGDGSQSAVAYAPAGELITGRSGKTPETGKTRHKTLYSGLYQAQQDTTAGARDVSLSEPISDTDALSLLESSFEGFDGDWGHRHEQNHKRIQAVKVAASHGQTKKQRRHAGTTVTALKSSVALRRKVRKGRHPKQRSTSQMPTRRKWLDNCMQVTCYDSSSSAAAAPLIENILRE